MHPFVRAIALLSVSLVSVPTRALGQGASSAHVARPELMVGIQVSAPQKVALGAGLVFPWRRTMESFSGVLAAAEAGVGGGRMSIGVATYTAPKVVGAQLRASILRTWESPWKVAPRQTFAGPEARLTLGFLTVGGGGYWRVSGNAPGDERLISFSLGLGL
jgi:hypothetical protein